MTVGGTLTLTSGRLTLNQNNLIMSSSAGAIGPGGVAAGRRLQYVQHDRRGQHRRAVQVLRNRHRASRPAMTSPSGTRAATTARRTTHRPR